MTTDWKPTIHQAYINPNLLPPNLQRVIPTLIKDEIHRLANITLFQNNFQSNSESSQVPVDMRFTDDSLNIRVSKNAPWISLLPSTSPMTPEEQTVDTIRREVMEKIALLWGGVPDSSSDESDSMHTNTSGLSTDNKTSARIRSKRGKRDQQNKEKNNKRAQTTISNNNIDLSNHSTVTTNNYYSSEKSRGENNFGTTSPNKDSKSEGTQTNDTLKTTPENTHKSDPALDDSVSDEDMENLQKRFKRFKDDLFVPRSTDQGTQTKPLIPPKPKLKASAGIQTDNTPKITPENTHKSDPALNDLLSKQDLEDLHEDFKKLEQKKLKLKTSAGVQTDTDLDRTIPKSTQAIGIQVNPLFRDQDIQTDSEAVDKNNKAEDFKSPTDGSPFKGEAMSETNSIPTLRPTSYNTEDPLVEIKKFVNNYDRESKPVGHLRTFIELQIELAQEQPDLTKINNFMSFLQADSIQNISEEDSSDSESTLVASEETTFENEFLDPEDPFIDTEIKDQPTPTYMQTDNFAYQDDVLDSLLNSDDIFTELQIHEMQNASTQTDVPSIEGEESYTVEELQAEIESLVYDIESYKKVITNSNQRADEQVYKNQESASKLLNLLDQQEILQKIIKNLEMQLDNTKSTNKRLSSDNENLKKELDIQDRRGIDSETKVSYLAQQLANSENDLKELLNSLASHRNNKISPKTDDSSILKEVPANPPLPEEVPVEKTIPIPSKSTSSKITTPMKQKSQSKRKLRTMQPESTTSFESEASQYKRNIAAATIQMLRKEKAAAEHRQHKGSSKERAQAQSLIKMIDEELTLRNQKNPSSSKTTNSNIKKPTNQAERNRMDLGGPAFNKQQARLNNKR